MLLLIKLTIALPIVILLVPFLLIFSERVPSMDEIDKMI